MPVLLLKGLHYKQKNIKTLVKINEYKIVWRGIARIESQCTLYYCSYYLYHETKITMIAPLFSAACACLFYILSVEFIHRHQWLKSSIKDYQPEKSFGFYVCVLLALCSHALLVSILFDGVLHNVSVMNMLALCSLGMSFIGLFRLWFFHDPISYAIVALLASVCVWLPLWLNTKAMYVLNTSLKIHILLSIVAYISLGFAALYALFLWLKDWQLRHPSHFLAQQFHIRLALFDIERTMMRFTHFATILLSLSLFTGILFIHDIWAQHVAHKLVFGLISWLIMLLLLWRYHHQGFRGRQASIWVLFGFSALVLAYFGSAFVLQLLL